MICQKFLLVEIVIFLHLCQTVTVSSLDCKDLEDMDVSCPPSDTCLGRVPVDSVISHSCDCGPSCARHGTCCIDSPYKDVKLPVTLEECKWLESLNRSVFVVSKCSPLWDGPERTKELCERGLESWEDPVIMIPVTKLASGVTYANVFCSLCNMEEDVHFWDFRLTRVERWNESPRMCAGIVPRTLEYTNISGEYVWGYWHEYITNRKTFISLDANVEVPDNSRALVTECFENVVSECAKDWADEEMRRKCESYMAAIEVPVDDEDTRSVGNRTYRNIHCALCNRVENLSKATCKLTEIKIPKLRFGGTKLSFPYQLPEWQCFLHIAGIESMDAPRDCRTVVCDPGYKIGSDQCTPVY